MNIQPNKNSLFVVTFSGGTRPIAVLEIATEETITKAVRDFISIQSELDQVTFQLCTEEELCVWRIDIEITEKGELPYTEKFMLFETVKY